MISGTKFSRIACVISLLSACGAPDSPPSRAPVVGARQGAEDSDCTSVEVDSKGLGLLDTKAESSDKSAQLDSDDSNCLPSKKPLVAPSKKSGSAGTVANNPQDAASSVPQSSNVNSNNSDGSPFSNSGLSGGLGGLAGGLGGLTGGLGGLSGLAGSLGGLGGGLSGLSGLGGLTGGLGGLSGLTSGLGGLTGGLGNFGNLGGLFGGGQSNASTGSGSNSNAVSTATTPAPASGAVTYSAQVSSYLNSACVRCHSYLGNYEGAKLTANDSLNRMKSGNMPPGGGVSSSNLSMFQAWVNAGQPQ